MPSLYGISSYLVKTSFSGVSDPRRRVRRGWVTKNIDLTCLNSLIRLIEGAILVKRLDVCLGNEENFRATVWINDKVIQINVIGCMKRKPPNESQMPLIVWYCFFSEGTVVFYWKFANLIGSLMVGLLSDRCPVRENYFWFDCCPDCYHLKRTRKQKDSLPPFSVSDSQLSCASLTIGSKNTGSRGCLQLLIIDRYYGERTISKVNMCVFSVLEVCSSRVFIFFANNEKAQIKIKRDKKRNRSHYNVKKG